MMKNNKNSMIFLGWTDSELPKNVGRSTNSFQKSKLNMFRVNSLRPNRDKQINIVAPINNEWNVKSGCHFSCIEQSMGIQIISSKLDQSTNIQLCHAEFVVSYLCLFHISNTLVLKNAYFLPVM